MNTCPYCNSQNTFPLVKVTAEVTEHVCDDCGCTFNVVPSTASGNAPLSAQDEMRGEKR